MIRLELTTGSGGISTKLPTHLELMIRLELTTGSPGGVTTKLLIRLELTIHSTGVSSASFSSSGISTALSGVDNVTYNLFLTSVVSSLVEGASSAMDEPLEKLAPATQQQTHSTMTMTQVT